MTHMLALHDVILLATKQILLKLEQKQDSGVIYMAINHTFNIILFKDWLG